MSDEARNPVDTHLSAIICARGETPEDVLMTVESLYALRGEVRELDITVVDDNGDGDISRYAAVTRMARTMTSCAPQGRGVSANMAYGLVKGHPLFPDAHMIAPPGTLRMVGQSIESGAITCCGVQGLEKEDGCQGYGAEFRFHRKHRLGVKMFQPPKDNPDGPWRVPQPFGGFYGFPRPIFERLGGWTDLAAKWGYCEQPIGYAAWVLDIPVMAQPVIVKHRFRKVNPSGGNERDIWINVAYAHYVLFQPETWENYWRPIVEQHLPPAAVNAIIGAAGVADRRAAWQAKRPKDRTDARFFEEMLGMRVDANADGSVNDAITASIILPAYNEGDEVLHTTRSIRKSSSRDPEVLHVNDASTDGCCARTMTVKDKDGKPVEIERIPKKIRILSNPTRRGVTRCRMIGVRATKELICVFMDDHSRTYPGHMDKFIDYAWDTKGLIVGTCCHFRDPAEIVPEPRKRNYGSRFCVKPGWGLRGAYLTLPPAERLHLTNMAMGSWYGIRRDVLLDKLNGWPRLPGKWAYSEQALAMKCWAVDVPILTATDVLVWHKVKDEASCGLDDVLLNAHFVHRAYFDEDTYRDIWRPILLERGNSPRIDDMLLNSPELKAEIAWYAANRKHTDEEFFRCNLGKDPALLLSIDEKAGTAKPHTQAEYIAYEVRRSPGKEWNADRPRMEQRHVPDLLAQLGDAKLADTRLLDLGSRDGWILDKLQEVGFAKDKLTGMELIPWAAKNARNHGRNVLTGDMHNLEAFKDGEMDVVTMIHSLEHCHTPGRALAEAFRVLKPGGWCMVVVPIEPEGVSLRGDHCYSMKSPEAVAGLLTAAGFELGDGKMLKNELTCFARKPGAPEVLPVVSISPRLDLLRGLGVKTKQNVIELNEAGRHVAALAPKVFVEIGSYLGGSLYAYAAACAPGATLIAVDFENDPEDGKVLSAVIQKLRDEGFDAHWVKGHSREPATVEEVKRLLAGRAVDALHIDGNHNYREARGDYERYTPLVRPGGLVLLHDAVNKCGVPRLFAEVSQGKKSVLLDTSKDTGRPLGIGLVWMEEARP